MPVPTNTTAATALLIENLPYSVTLDAQLLAPSDVLWFRYDKVVGGNMILALASPEPITTGTYIPVIEAWTGPDPSSLTPYLGIFGTRVPVSVPLDTLIVSYYFSVTQDGGGAFTEQLLFQAAPGPVAAAPAGSFIINDDTDGFPAAVVSSVDGSVFQSFPFPAGERAAILPSGVSLWHDQFNRAVALYSAQFVKLTDVVWAPIADHLGTPEAPISASLTTFYLGDTGSTDIPTRNAQVAKVSSAGVVGQVYDLGSYFVWSLAPTLDDAILYYTQSSLGAIKRWDLVNDVALTDLVAGVSSYQGTRDILVMGSGSVVMGYRGTSPFVRVYSAAGATLVTISVVGATLNRLAHAADGTSFWVWAFPTSPVGTSRFTRYRASDGVQLESFEAVYSNAGVWAGASPGTPTEAHSFSCPFFETPEYLPPITFAPEPVTSYGTRTVIQRRLRRAPHISDEQRVLLYQKFQIDMRTGIGLSSGQGSDPQLMLRWSNDGGHTWSNEHWTTAGRMGARKTRALWRQLGRGRTRTFEVSVSDPVPWLLSGAWVDVTPGTGN